jgi:hypothetical protein
LRRAVRQVIHIFQKKNAINQQLAMNLEDLRLKPRSYLQNMMNIRDYKPAALNMLIEAGILLKTADEKYYLSEEALMNSPLGIRFKPRKS